jgi:hypothetical protein
MVKHACFLNLAGLFVPLLAAQTVPRHAGPDVKTVDLLSRPESKLLVNARKAFVHGDIVRIIGGTPEDLQRLLGVGGASLTRFQSSASASNPLYRSSQTKSDCDLNGHTSSTPLDSHRAALQLDRVAA